MVYAKYIVLALTYAGASMAINRKLRYKYVERSAFLRFIIEKNDVNCILWIAC